MSPQPLIVARTCAPVRCLCCIVRRLLRRGDRVVVVRVRWHAGIDRVRLGLGFVWVLVGKLVRFPVQDGILPAQKSCQPWGSKSEVHTWTYSTWWAKLLAAGASAQRAGDQQTTHFSDGFFPAVRFCLACCRVFRLAVLRPAFHDTCSVVVCCALSLGGGSCAPSPVDCGIW
jgi:hypothetical protein